MAQKSGMFNAVDGLPEYSDTDVATYMSMITQGTGVLRGYLDEMEVADGGGLAVDISAGGAWIGEPAGWWYINDDTLSIELDAEVSGVNRIDRVILKLDRNTNERVADIQIKKGVANASPTAPSLVQNATEYEISLAQVTIVGGSTTISVVDERCSQYCGFLQIGNIKSISRPTSIAAGYCALTDDGVDTVAQNGIGVSDGTRLVSSGICRLDSLESGYNYYAQSDGSVTTDVTEYRVGFALNSSQLLIDIAGDYGQDVAYTDNMELFNAIPAKATEVWLQIEMPSSADGVMIRRDTSAYDDSGITWGTEVADIIDDSAYHGDNNFYEDTSLLTGTRYYYKAFPYKGTNYNTVDGENEKSSYCRDGEVFWPFDSISGSTIADEFTSIDATASNVTYTPVKIGDGVVVPASNTAAKVVAPAQRVKTGFTIHEWVNFSGAVSYIFSESVLDSSTYGNRGYELYIDTSGDLKFVSGQGGSLATTTVSLGLTSGVTYLLSIYINVNSNTIKVRIDDEESTESETFTAPLYTFNPSYMGIGWTGFNTNATQIGRGAIVDQFRWYDGDTTDLLTCEALYNGGDGC